METQTVTAHIPKKLVSKVDAIADLLERPRGWVVKQALSDWVANQEEHHRMTLEALSSVDAGMGVPHDEVSAWLNSLGTEAELTKPVARKIL